MYALLGGPLGFTTSWIMNGFFTNCTRVKAWEWEQLAVSLTELISYTKSFMEFAYLGNFRDYQNVI